MSELYPSVNISDERILALSNNLKAKNSTTELSKFDDFFIKLQENNHTKQAQNNNLQSDQSNLGNSFEKSNPNSKNHPLNSKNQPKSLLPQKRSAHSLHPNNPLSSDQNSSQKRLPPNTPYQNPNSVYNPHHTLSPYPNPQGTKPALTHPQHEPYNGGSKSALMPQTGGSRFDDFNSYMSMLKKAYYTIAMRDSSSYHNKLDVLNKLMTDNLEVTPNDSEMIENLVIKINDKSELENHVRFFYGLVDICKLDYYVNSLCYLFLMLIFEEICLFCKKINDRKLLVKLFLEIQFIKFPKELTNFKQYKKLLIKYFSFYMMKNFAFLDKDDAIRDIIQKHEFFKNMVKDKVEFVKVDGIVVNIVNPLEVIKGDAVLARVYQDAAEMENFFDMFRLEIEIWENFMFQITNLEKSQVKNYQSMLRSVIFHHFLKKLPKLSKPRLKTILGNFLHDLCIHNDELVK